MRLLAGDIGGTNTRLQLVEMNQSGHALQVIASQTFPSQDYADLHTPVQDFLHQHPDSWPSAACLAVAGPVQDAGAGQSARLTNLPWQLHSASLAER